MNRAIKPSAQFTERLRSLQISGSLQPSHKRGLIQALNELKGGPPASPSFLPLAMNKEPHRVKKCLDGEYDTGLRILFLLDDDGNIVVDGLYLNRPMSPTQRNRPKMLR